MKKLLLTVAAICLALVAGCQGASRQVDSCTECRDNANWRADEYCVSANSGQLYCANPCMSHIDCAPHHWCVPLWDEGTPWDYGCNCIRWVCMPETYYVSMKRVWYWGTTNCVAGGSNPCPSGMQCLVDDSGATDYYFCSDRCYSHSECVGGCCSSVGGGESYCAPKKPYCVQ